MVLLKRSGRPVYLTPYIMCFFNRDAAECLKHMPVAERKKPLTHKCEPLNCANSVLTRLQVAGFLEDFEAYAAMAVDPSQSPSQKVLATEEMGGLATLIAPFVPVLRRESTWLEEILRGADPKEAETVGLRSRQAEVASLLRRISVAEVERLANAP